MSDEPETPAPVTDESGKKKPSTKDQIKGAVVLAVIVGAVLFWVFRPEDGASPQAEAFCRVLDRGGSVNQALRAAGRTFDSTVESAAFAAVWAEDGCPSQLRTNEALESFLDANNIPYG